MSQFIDRRISGKNKSAVNRQRFIRRYKNHIKRAVSEAIAKRSITDMNKGEEITIFEKDISEPHFQHGQGGTLERVFPGNTDFVSGDRIKRSKNNSDVEQGKASENGEGTD